jgi:hypothetical protein
MKTRIKIRYEQPAIIKIKLDEMFSLSLESLPPFGPGESIGQGFGLTNNDPDKSNSIV